MALDTLAPRLARFGGWRRAGACLRGEGRVKGETVVLVKPQTYMNASGAAIEALLREGWAAQELLVVCDDVYLPLGTIRMRARGGTAGHQGLESILEVTGTQEFPRLRIGVGPAPASADLPAYVLASFADEERARLPAVLDAAAGALYDAAAVGVTHAMNRWNRFGLETVEE
jgi:PTH1 family peptidyl-tRNA hydrolase